LSLAVADEPPPRHPVMGEPGFRRENVSELEYPEANIPPSAWTSAGLRWPDLILKTPDGQYFEMAVSTEALFREFPQPASSVEGGQVGVTIRL
jgi:hypothetical protein